MPLSKAPSFRQLTAFHTVARLGSVSLAARELHLTQPALSIQIGALETSAGTRLLERTGRGVRLTHAGECLAAYVARILDLWREAGEEIATLHGEFSGTLRLGAVSTAEYLLPALLVPFASRNPKVKVSLQVGNRHQILRMLAAEEVDIAVIGRPPPELRIVAGAFARNPMGFMAAPEHPLMTGDTVTLASLAATPLLVRERGSGTRTSLEGLFRAAGLSLRIGSELSSNEAIKQLCAAGFGPAYLSLHTCMLEMNAGLLKLLPMADNPVERQWFVAHLAARPLPQVAVAFEQFVLTEGQTQIRDQLDLKLLRTLGLQEPFRSLPL
jgi:DNA-binding transcriptional LysR family regulator